MVKQIATKITENDDDVERLEGNEIFISIKSIEVKGESVSIFIHERK